MGVTGPIQPDTLDYPSHFREYIGRSITYVLHLVEQQGPTLSASVCDQALHILSFALKLPGLWETTQRLLLVLAPKVEMAAYRESWIDCLQQAAQQSSYRNDPLTTAELQFYLGALYQRQGDYSNACRYLQDSIEKFEQCWIDHRVVEAVTRLAYIRRLQRRFDEAHILLTRARRLVAQNGQNLRELAYIDYVAGLIALDQRGWAQALTFSESAMAAYRQTEDEVMYGRTLLCQGVALEKMGEFDQALEICRQATAAFERQRHDFYHAIARMNLGNVYMTRQQPALALELYREAERSFQQMEDILHLAHVYHNQGLCYRHLRKLGEAKSAYGRSIRLWQQLGNLERLVNSLDGLALTELEAGNEAAARQILEQATEQLDQIGDAPGYTHWRAIITARLERVRLTQ